MARLFMGAGEHSGAKCYELIVLLQEAFVDISGLQQLGLQGQDYDVSEAREIEFQIVTRAVEIAHALTGASKQKLYTLFREEIDKSAES